MGYLSKSDILKLSLVLGMAFVHTKGLHGLACGSRFVWVIMCVWAPILNVWDNLHACLCVQCVQCLMLSTQYAVCSMKL